MSRSIFGCYPCGLSDSYIIMDIQRASLSRRQDDVFRGPVARSRSSEKFMEEPYNNTQVEMHPGADLSSLDGDELTGGLDLTAAGGGGGGGHHGIPQQRQRAMSDPLDSQGDESKQPPPKSDLDASAFATKGGGVGGGNHTTASIHHQQPGLPTLPRFPVAESRNKNCFSEPPISLYQIRGPHYFQDQVKIQSNPFLLSARGCDLFLADNNDNPAQDTIKKMTHSILNGRLRRAPTLAINFRFPWGYMNLYFEIPKKLAMYMKPGTPLPNDRTTLTVPERTLVQWFQGDTNYRNERLKLIALVAEGPWVVRQMVTGRPAIIGKKLPVSYYFVPGGTSETTDAPLLMATLDIGSSSATAKRIVSVCRRYMSSLTVDIGFVIQAEMANELPEQMLGSIRVHHADPLKAPKL